LLKVATPLESVVAVGGGAEGEKPPGPVTTAKVTESPEIGKVNVPS
jgi:hypothetical protein